MLTKLPFCCCLVKGHLHSETRWIFEAIDLILRPSCTLWTLEHDFTSGYKILQKITYTHSVLTLNLLHSLRNSQQCQKFFARSFGTNLQCYHYFLLQVPKYTSTCNKEFVYVSSLNHFFMYK